MHQNKKACSQKQINIHILKKRAVQNNVDDDNQQTNKKTSTAPFGSH